MDWDKFLHIPTDLTLWHILDSQFLTTVLAAGFGVLLLRYETKLREAQADAQAAEEALRTRDEVERKEAEQEPEAPPVATGGQAGANYRDQAKAQVEEAKEFLTARAKADQDGRHARTYGKISGHHPSDLALALRDRGQISDDQFESAFRLFSMWKKYARGKAANNIVPKAVFDEVNKLKDELVG